MIKPLHAEYSSLHDLAQAVQKNQIKIQDLTDSAIKYCLANQSYNIFTQIDTDLSLNQANLVSESHINQSDESLFGIPVAHQDLIVTTNWRTTAASKMLNNYISPFDATAVTKLKSSGTICIGKTNCDEFGLGFDGSSSVSGVTLNPHNKQYSAGSTASSAAVASKCVVAATAVDTTGHARVSSAWCGTSAIKPTYGIVSRYGVVASGSSLESISVIANSAQDLLHLLCPISCFDANDGTSLQICNTEKNQPTRILDSFNKNIEKFNQNTKPLNGINIGVLQGLNKPSDNTQASFDIAAKQLAELGANLTPINIELAELSANTAFLIHSAEAATNLSRYDGVHFGYRAAQHSDIHDLITKSRSQGFGMKAQQRIMFGNYVLSHQQYDKYYLQAQRIRAVISNNLQKAFTQCDIIISPTVIDTAPTLDLTHSPASEINNYHYTAIANLTGTPAISIPIGTDQTNNLPIGMQIIGNHFAEGLLLAIASAYQNVTKWHQHNLELQ